MKQTLLAVLFSFISLAGFAQSAPDGSEVPPFPHEFFQPEQAKISIYPNPATNYISIDQDENVYQIAIFNLVGRKLVSFENVQKDMHYDVSNLPNGMYLVRIVDHSDKIITTQRISKR